jgi:diaminopimelate epimerase
METPGQKIDTSLPITTTCGSGMTAAIVNLALHGLGGAASLQIHRVRVRGVIMGSNMIRTD